MTEHAPEDFFDTNGEPIETRIAVALAKIGMAIKQQAIRSAGEQKLSPTQAQILALLRAEEPLRPSDLATKLGVSLATVSDSVRALVQKLLVTKAPDPSNARSTLLSLTKAGQRSARETADWPDFLASAVGCLDAREQEVFLQGLLKMIRTLQERGEIPVARMCVSCKYFRPFAHAGERPHHCALVNAPMGKRHLRVDCLEHEQAEPKQQEETWFKFLKAT